jgi:hypothetical protein
MSASMMDTQQSNGPTMPAAKADGEGLSVLHSRLAAHFRDLREHRDALGQGAPIFALEHGLPDADLALLKAGILSAVRQRRLPKESWLPLVVYAAELGYSYSGEEYWQTFESRTPGWAENGDRQYIRTVFEKFSGTFGGVRPSGTWANWFSIISWPITHAVLPADLQRQFARLMFDYRTALTADLLADPGELGLKLAARASHYSSRFQNFAQNTDLLGQVAAALLAGDDENSPYLQPSTLRRLAGSLTSERQSRKWLQDTRWSARQVRSRGFQPPAHKHGGTVVPPSGLPSATDPVLSLRRGKDGWAAWLSVPDLSVLAERLPGIHEELGRLRPRVASASRGVFPRGQLLFAGLPVELATWPAPDAPLIELEGGRPTTNAVLADHCVLPPGPWVFRVRDSGIATELRGKIVHPGGRYILVRRDALKTAALPKWVAPTDCSTGGVHAYDLRVPSLMDECRAEEARILGLAVQADVIIRPAGVAAADWDGEGTAGWLAGEDVILSLRATRSIASCAFEVAGVNHRLDWPGRTDEIFVTVAGLGTGAHQARITLLSPVTAQRVASGTFVIIVRDPFSRSPGGTLREGLALIASPATPTLTEVWDGRADVQILGPPGVRVRAEVALANRHHKIIARQELHVTLPLELPGWRRLAATRIRESAALQGAYDEAESCLITVSDPRLGSAELRCEREFAPVRWTTGADHEGPFADLVDNTETGAVTVGYFTFSAPDQSAGIAASADGRMRRTAGGLLRAQTGSFEAAVILPPKIRNLTDLQEADIRPRIASGPHTTAEVQRLLDVARMWAAAALPANPVAQHERRTVLRAVTSQISCLISGSRWARLEQQTQTDTPRIGAMQAAIGAAPYQVALAGLIADRLEAWRGAHPEERAADLGSMLDAHLPGGIGPGSARRAELLLRLASEPATIEAWPQHEVNSAIERAIIGPVLMRAARFAVLAIHATTDQDTGTTYRGWEWT